MVSACRVILFPVSVLRSTHQIDTPKKEKLFPRPGEKQMLFIGPSNKCHFYRHLFTLANVSEFACIYSQNHPLFDSKSIETSAHTP